MTRRTPPPTDFPAPFWYHNTGGTIWAGLAPPANGQWVAGVSEKLGWWRQQGKLAIDGRRLDNPAGDAIPLQATVPDG